MEREKELKQSKFKKICVFCGSSQGNKSSYQDAAIELGKELVARNIDLVYGGGSVGLMGLVSQAVYNGGRHVLGVIPKTLMPRECWKIVVEIAWNGRSWKETYHFITGETVGEVRKAVADMHQRKAEMARQSDAFIALPVLTIPGIAISGLMIEIILRNLLVYEIYTYDYSYITEYAVFLKSLINSGKDVELLQESGILMVPTYDPEFLAIAFNDLPKYVPKYTNFTRPICHELMKYSNKSLHKWKASLMLSYFNTPWTIKSVVAAIILLFLTVMQTTYAALSYHN